MVAPQRRLPWPCDIRIGGVGMMMGRPQQDAPLIISKSQPYTDQAGPDQEAAATAVPLVEDTYVFRGNMGYGQKVQGTTGQEDTHSRFCLGADTSVDGLIMKGPAITTFTPGTTDNTNGVVKFIESNGKLFAVAGRYWLKYVSDSSWTVSKDFGSGVFAIDAETFQSSGGTPSTPILWACLNSTNKTQYSTDDGATWTAMATHINIAMSTVGRELYRASSTNFMSKVDANSDPTNEANWTNAYSFAVGDGSHAIQKIAQTALGYPLVFKTDGIYTIDADGSDHHLYPNAVSGGTSEDGKYFFNFGNDVHVTYGKQHVRLVPTVSFGNPRLELQPIGPERFVSNDSEVRGRITAGAPNGSLGAYAGLYNEDTGDSYLLKFGSFAAPDQNSQTPDESSRIDSWHGSISQKFSSIKLTAMIRSSIGAPSNHYRCYMGFSDGSLAWFTMPNTPNPAADTSYAFDNTTDATVNWPLFHGNHEADAKSIRGFSVAGTTLTTTEYATWNYKIDPSQSAYTALGTNFTNTPRGRVDLTAGVKSYLADFQLVLHNTNTSASPIVTAPALHYAIVPVTILIYEGMIQSQDGLLKRNASPLRIGRSRIRSVLQSAVGSGGTTVIFPDESQKVVNFIDFGEKMTWDERTKSWGAGLSFTCVEYVTNTPSGSGSVNVIYGTVLRLQPYQVGDLAGYTVSNLGTL